VRTGLGLALTTTATIAALVVVLTLWRRVAPGIALALVGALSAAGGVGVLLLQDDPGPADWVVAPAVLAAFTPLHCRMVFGPPGRTS
jgi:hypothetical protein